jgi:hypothetical protein
MALQQLPVVQATIEVVHTGDVADFTGFTTTLDAADGAPLAPQQVYTFDLTVFAPSLVGLSPAVSVFEDVSGKRVEADVEVDSALITISFFEPVEPSDYRVKVIG